MNWLVIATMIYLIIMIVSGYRKGFVKIAFGLLSTVISLILVSACAPQVKEFLIIETSLYSKLEQTCSNQIQNKLVENQAGSPDTLQGVLEGANIQLPSSLETLLGKVRINQEAASEKVGAVIADWLVYAIAFLATFIVIMLILRLIGNLLDLVTRLPLIKGTNRLLGCGAGFIQGIIMLWVLALVLSMFCSTDTGQYFVTLVYENPWLRLMYDHNGIIYLVALFL